nr:hypothetical protein [Piscirickettsia salmonis]
MVNRSINDTLSRTLMTSGLTLLVVVILYVFGGPALQPFALVLIIGILIGTYSSIYIAGALSIKLGINRLSMMPSKKKKIADLNLAFILITRIDWSLIGQLIN